MRRAAWTMVAAAAAWAMSPGTAAASGTDDCPEVGSSYLAWSCGNGVCDGTYPDEENAYNCQRDCGSSLVRSFYVEYAYCPDVVRVEVPTSTAEAQADIQQAISEGHRVNFAGSGHSANDVMCNDGVVVRSRLPNDDGLDICTGLCDVFGLESNFEGEEVVHFEAGVSYGDLFDFLESNGKMLNYATTWIDDITPAGAIATGVHGSLNGGYSSISHYLRWVKMVGADGQIHEYSEGTTGVTDPELWRAIRANLGALGMVTELRLAVRDRTSLHARIDYYPESDLLAAGGISNLAQGCDFFALQWFPGPYTESLIRHCAWETTETEIPTAANIFIAPDQDPNLQWDFRWNMQLASCDDLIAYSEENKRRDFWVNNPPLVKDPADGTAIGNHVTDVVGPWHRLINWSIPPEQVDFSQTDFEVAIPMDQFDAAVNAVHDFVENNGMAYPVSGALFRLDQADDATILGGNALGSDFTQGEQIVHFEVNAFTPWDHSELSYNDYMQRWRDQFMVLLDNYSVRPHWGKNENWVFSDPAVMAENASRRSRFQSILDAMDPNGHFARVHLARAGFSWPNGPDFDVDGDGMTDSTEVSLGSDPDTYNGLRMRIDNADPSGSCNYMDDYAEMESRFTSPAVDKYEQQEWYFDCGSHNFLDSCYQWAPAIQNTNGFWTWGVRLNGHVFLDQAGTYCFSADNASYGDGIVSGINACMQVWVDEGRLAEVGYNAAGNGASPKSGCITVNEPGWHTIDLVGRYHDANAWRDFTFRPLYCYGGGGSCTPNQQIPQHILVPDGEDPY